MFKQLKRFFGGGHPSDESDRASAVLEAPRTTLKPVPTRVPVPQARAVATKSADKPCGQTCEFNDEDVSLCLPSVLDALPPELKAKLVPMDIRGATLTVALHKVLPQLSSGSVRLSFGEIRRAAPMLFSMGDESDHQEIELPLNELLTKINPALLQQTQDKEPAANLDALDSVFNYSGELLPEAGLSEMSASPEVAAATPAQSPMRVPLPASVPDIFPGPSPVAPATRTPVVANSSAASPVEESPMIVPLASLASTWPKAVRAEIAQLNCGDAQVALPVQLVKAGMKLGKVVFSWQTIRSWIKPPPAAVISKDDNTILNLPLEVLMPLFVARLQQTPQAQSKIVVDESIPALFGPTSSPESQVKIGSTSLNAAMVQTDGAGAVPKLPGTDFKNRYISPTDVVARAMALNGVAGALVVLPEGLLVAGKLSTNQDPDALAAFLARAFGRVSECALESHVGELSHLEFAADGVPWHIFRLHGVLFAALGLAGGTLPKPQLTALARELDQKKRN